MLKPNAIVYMRRNNLIVGGKRIKPVKLTLKANLVNNLEVIDADKMIATCEQFFSSHDLKGKRVLIVLDQSIVFTKSVDITKFSKNDIEYIFNDFVIAMPYQPGQRACIQVVIDDQLKLYAANSNLYQAIIEALRLCGAHKIVAVTPGPAYEVDYATKASEVVNQFMVDKKVRHSIDFADVSPL